MSADPLGPVRQRAPEACELIREIGPYSAEGAYACAFLAYRLEFIDQRPSASGFGLGVDHAALVRDAVESSLPADVPPES